jgi:hypothetical protein
MKPSELATYRVGQLLYGSRCFLCDVRIEAGDQCLFVPVNCDETVRMDAGQEYEFLTAHRSCMERVP